MLKKINFDEVKNIVILSAILLIAFVFIHNELGSSLFDSSSYNSYDLQAQAWLNGKIHLDKDYPWLELAIYNGRYYVSFPPLPSVVVLPFVMMFGLNAPDNFIIFLIILANCIVAYKLLRKCGSNVFISILLSCGLVLGSNMFSMAVNGGVWFIAQALNMLLCTMAIYFIISERRAFAYTALALAVRMQTIFCNIYCSFIYLLLYKRKKTTNKRICTHKYITTYSSFAYCYNFYGI